MLAAVRPHSWDPALFLHVLGAMVFTGALVAAALALVVVSEDEHRAKLRRLAFRTLLVVGLPAYVAMIVGGEWITSKEGLGGENDPAWFRIGIVVGDLTGLLLVISIVLAGIASWKSKAGLGRVAGGLITVALIASVIAVWVMTAKPGDVARAVVPGDPERPRLFEVERRRELHVPMPECP